MALNGPVWALGAMSGTSLDGVDAALLETDGETIYAFGDTGYRPYEPAERETIRAALGCWPGDAPVAAAAEVVETAHAELLSRYVSQAEIVGFHGQTLAHDPRGRGTHQAGDGGVLAAVLGLPVVWDFRTADVKLGGQGAPLAPFYHFALARWMELDAPVAFLNLGGVGNVTWADPRKTRPEETGALLAFDTGPANAPIDDLVHARRGAAHDEGGKTAAQGQPDETILDAFLGHPYFFRIPPKSLDRNDFAALSRAVEGLSEEDAAATLTAACAASVARGCEHFPHAPEVMFVSGGGRHNATLMAMLARRLPFPVLPIEETGLDGDMIEAQAFAHLAVRVLRGLPTSCPATTGVAAAVGGGQLSRPEG